MAHQRHGYATCTLAGSAVASGAGCGGRLARRGGGPGRLPRPPSRAESAPDSCAPSPPAPPAARPGAGTVTAVLLCPRIRWQSGPSPSLRPLTAGARKHVLQHFQIGRGGRGLQPRHRLLRRHAPAGGGPRRRRVRAERWKPMLCRQQQALEHTGTRSVGSGGRTRVAPGASHRDDPPTGPATRPAATQPASQSPPDHPAPF